MTISDFTERELVGRIQQRLPPAPGWMVVGIGDDAAVVEPERNRLEVLTVDAVVEGVHFDRAFTPPDAIGHRALAVNLSDLAAMGASPRLALVSLALPAAFDVDDFDGVVSGLVALATRHRLHLAGGNLTRSPGPLVIDITLVGTVKPRRALTRAGARAGDELYVTGSIGGAAAGLQMLKAGRRLSEEVGSAPSAAEDNDVESVQVRPGASPASSPVRGSLPESCIRRYLYPEPRVRIGTLVARNRAAGACIDLSDGLADAVHQIARASGVGAIVDAGALPIEPGAHEWTRRQGGDPVLAAISSGDDYELLVAVRPRTSSRLAAAERHGDAPLTRVGVCTAAGQVVLRRDGADEPMPEGYSHFR